MRRVLFVTPSAYILSGLAAWLDALEQHLPATGWEPVIGLVQGPRFHQPEAYLAVHPHRHALTIACNTGTPAGRQMALARALKSLRPDVVAGVNIPDTYPAVARQQVRQSSLRNVMTVHGVQPNLYEDLRCNAQILDAVICTNQLSCALAQQRAGMPAQRVLYAPYGVELGPQRQAAGDKLRIGWVGRLEQDQKRVMDLPAIVQELEKLNLDYRLTVVGSGPEEAALRAALGARVGREVEMLGYVEPELVRQDIYPRLDALLITSSWETGPIVAWEAMVAGVPVVSSAYLGSCQEDALRDDDSAALFAVGDSVAAASRLARLRSDRSWAARIAQQGAALASSRYSVAASARAWGQALDTVAGRPPVQADLSVLRRARPRGQGRLDQILGPTLAETVRRVLPGRFQPGGPGDEWPHSYGSTPAGDRQFWQQVRTLEMGGNSA